MKLEMMFIGACLFGVIFVTGLSILGENLSTYGVQGDTSTFGKMSTNLKGIYDYQNSMKENIQGGTVSDTDAVDQMLRGGYTSIRNNPFTAVTVATNATMTLAQETGFVSAAFIAFFATVIGILVLFAIIALIFKFDQR